MGNNTSKIDTAYNLTPHTLSVLKRFETFSEFPNDCSVVDCIISNQAANTLKYVDYIVSLRLSKHKKEKEILQVMLFWIFHRTLLPLLDDDCVGMIKICCVIQYLLPASCIIFIMQNQHHLPIMQSHHHLPIIVLFLLLSDFLFCIESSYPTNYFG